MKNSNSHNPSLLSFFCTLTQEINRLQVRLRAALLNDEFIKGDYESSKSVSHNLIQVIQLGQVCAAFIPALLQKLFTPQTERVFVAQSLTH